MLIRVSAKHEELLVTAIKLQTQSTRGGFTSAELTKDIGNGYRPQAVGGMLNKLEGMGAVRKICRLPVKNGPYLWVVTPRGKQQIKG